MVQQGTRLFFHDENIIEAENRNSTEFSFQALSQNCEKPLLASLRLSVCPLGATRLHWTDFHEI
jgi:hypothetical protein